ncbi:MAG: ATP-binding protein, partial [Pseudomonadota bacterium]
LLTSVLRNLVSNAIRYTQSGGVLLGVRRSGQEALLCVHDTGRGIAKDDLGRIFQEFERGSSTDREGLGLGLAIVRRTSSLLDMRILTHSIEGKGSRFALSVPVHRWGTPMPITSIERPVRRIGEARVLVVDNDPAVLTATSALLSKWELDPKSATSLHSALELCPSPPDVVIMDYRLDGDERGDTVYGELCMAWKAQPPAILLTAEDSEETEFAAVAMDANRLLKPSSPAALRALISTCLVQRGEDRTVLDSQTAARSALG